MKWATSQKWPWRSLLKKSKPCAKMSAQHQAAKIPLTIDIPAEIAWFQQKTALGRNF
jgi:hypothetical protein